MHRVSDDEIIHAGYFTVIASTSPCNIPDLFLSNADTPKLKPNYKRKRSCFACHYFPDLVQTNCLKNPSTRTGTWERGTVCHVSENSSQILSYRVLSGPAHDHTAAASELKYYFETLVCVCLLDRVYVGANSSGYLNSRGDASLANGSVIDLFSVELYKQSS